MGKLFGAIKYGIFAAAALVAGAGAYLLWFSLRPLSPPPNIYTVQPGTSLHDFSRGLYAEHVLPDPRSLVLLAYLEGESRGLKAGEYRFPPGITALGMLRQVIEGKVVQYPFTIIDGWTFAQVMQALEAAPHMLHTLRNLTPAEIMASLGHPGVMPEGRFFPDTYDYAAGMSDRTVLERAYRRMQRALRKEWAERDRSVPLKTPDQALILASIIEKEASLPSERRIISGVFDNRLRLGMKLQTDPTVIYGLGNRYHGKITTADLRRWTPYNTYMISGLPPTPISMPSKEALYAALNPVATKALYFVARGNGTHVFSDTLQGQDRAVIKYQLHGGVPQHRTATRRATAPAARRATLRRAGHAAS
ncbi:MAG: endolytic transglycosylase MltG [Gammaproteobacteria bacterium]|nr:endolytic transglycosylase MltG [Gammaproteobacteria bacterium]